MAYEVDHVIPIRGKVRRNSDDWVLICGLDIPSNWQIVPKSDNREKWMFLGRDDARAEEDRLLKLATASSRRRPNLVE